MFVSAAFGDTFYFPIVYHTTPSEPYDPNRVIVHEYEETVMVPVLDKNGKPKKDEDGNVIMNEEIHKFEEEIEYSIVGSTEADSLNNKISNESPVGAALLGRKVGETVEVETQAGVLLFKILEIQRAN